MSVARAVTALFVISIVAVLIFAAGGPVVAAFAPPRRLSQVTHTFRAAVPPSRLPPPPPPEVTAASPQGSSPPPPLPVPVCGNGLCERGETVATCFADCPGVTTPAQCGEEPHSDPQGMAVVDGRGHHKASAAECCEACSAHAAKFPKRPCNSWVFCPLPHCWSADNGNTHLFGTLP